MVLHLLKLCVGVESAEELDAWIKARLEETNRKGLPAERNHTTRMIPRRAEELLDGGSLYWVIKGNIQVRQTLLDIREFRDQDGIRRCNLVLKPELIATHWQPRRPFQGWRYLKPEDAPADLDIGGSDIASMPLKLRRELSELGLL